MPHSQDRDKSAAERTLGDRILRHRQAAGLSKSALCRAAARAGACIAPQHIIAYESGRTVPTTPTLIALANALGLTMEQFWAATTGPQEHHETAGGAGVASATIAMCSARARARRDVAEAVHALVTEPEPDGDGESAPGARGE
jgi:transcriptional regulator with XRE-family HTH domain